MTSQLSAAVVGEPNGPADALARDLSARGVRVTRLPPGDRQTLAGAFTKAAPVRLVVWAPAPGASGIASPLLAHDEGAWDAEAAQPLRDAVACFQAAHDVLPDGASIVALLPTLAMSGAAGLTAWATAAEGLRSLVKVAAREFGKRRITVNAVALPAAVLAGSPHSLDRPGLPPALLPAPADAGGDVAGVIAALAAPPWTAVTGATIAVDGGVWMPA